LGLIKFKVSSRSLALNPFELCHLVTVARYFDRRCRGIEWRHHQRRNKADQQGCRDAAEDHPFPAQRDAQITRQQRQAVPVAITQERTRFRSSVGQNAEWPRNG
jgi:hypothetical protein